MIKALFWHEPILCSKVPYEVFKSGHLLYKSSASRFIYLSITNALYIFNQDFELLKKSFLFYSKERLTSIADYESDAQIVLGSEHGNIYLYSITNDRISTEIAISKYPISFLLAISQKRLYGITTFGEVFICTLYLGSSLRFISVNFLPESVEPVSDSSFLISGPQTCVYDYNRNSRTSESALKNAVWGIDTIYGFSETDSQLLICKSDLSVSRRVSFRFDQTAPSLPLANAKIYEGTIVLHNNDNSTISIYNPGTGQVLYSAVREPQNSVVYLTQGGIVAIQQGENGEAVIEKGVFCNNEELFHNLLKENKLGAAINLCVLEDKLQSLEKLQPLLIKLTRKKQKPEIWKEVEGAEGYRKFLAIVSRLENNEKEEENNIEEYKRKSTNKGQLWANVVLKKAKEIEEQKHRKAEQEFIEKTFKRQQEFRKCARWQLYMYWYKREFLALFPCIWSAPEKVTKAAYTARRVLKRTLRFIVENTPPEQILAIGQERRVEDYRVFKWMVRRIILSKDLLDYSTILQRRMNMQVLRLASIPYVRKAMVLAKASGNPELIREVNKSYIVLRQQISNYIL